MKWNLNKIYGLDSRSIVLFRVVLGIVLLWHLFFYIGLNFEAIYAPSKGFLGNFFRALPNISKHPFSPLGYLNKDWQLILFFCAYGVLLILFVLGKGISIVKFGVFFCFFAIQQRFSLSNNFSADIYFNTLLFIALILPLKGNLFNYKEILTKDVEFRSPIVLPILIQIGCIYLFTAIAKSGWMWHQGVATNLLFGDFQLNNNLSVEVLNKWTLIKFVTYFTLIFEWVFIILLFSPIFNKKSRLILSILLISFHFGISIFANVGIFKLAALCVAVLLLPNLFWNKVNSKSGTVKSEPPYNKLSKFLNALSIVLAFVIFNQNFSKMLSYDDGYFSSLRNSPIDKLSQALRIKSPEKSSFLNQNWHLYAPNPPKETGYIDFQIGYKDSIVSYLSGNSVKEASKKNPLKRNDLRRFIFHNLKMKMNEPSGQQFLAIYITYINEELKRMQKNEGLEFIQCVYYKPKMTDHKFQLPIEWEESIIANWSP